MVTQYSDWGFAEAQSGATLQPCEHVSAPAVVVFEVVHAPLGVRCGVTRLEAAAAWEPSTCQIAGISIYAQLEPCVKKPKIAKHSCM
jgi:hypothetical protein